MRNTRFIIIALIVASLAPCVASAQVLDEVIPYRGRLEMDGIPWNGSAEMRFRMYDDSGSWWWSETRADDSTDPNCDGGCRVEIVDGQFEVLLGENYPMLNIIYSGRVRELGVEVRMDDEWVELLPRQRLSGVPRAEWSDGIRSNDVEVAGAIASRGNIYAREAIDVGGALTVGGEANANSAQGATVSVAALTTEGGDLTTGGTLTVNGDVEVGTSVAFATSTQGAGGAALSTDSGLVIGDQSQTVDVRGNSVWTMNGETEIGMVWPTINGELRGPHWRLSDDRPLFRVEHFAFTGTNTSITTGISSADYVCWVGGVHMIDGDICESSTSSCGGNPAFRAIAMPNGVSSRWEIYADFQTHNSDESHEVMLVCVQARAVDFLCDSDTDGTSFYPADCSSERFFYNVPTSQIPGSWRQ